MNKLIRGSQFLLTAILLLSCKFPDLSALEDLPPVNPDPIPFDVSDIPVDLGYNLYANVDSTIIRLDSEHPSFVEQIATDLDPATPDFYITEEIGGHHYAVFARAQDADDNPGHFIVIKNLTSDDEVSLKKIKPEQELAGEFLIIGGDVVYSDNGTLKSYDIATGDPAAGGIDINASGDDYLCSHYLSYFTDGMITFAEHAPWEDSGTLHMIPYDGSPQPVVPAIIPYYDADFGERFYPISYDGTDLMGLTTSDSYDKLVKIFGGSGASGVSTVTCADTEEPVEFCKAYQTPDGAITILYGYDSVYWFDSADRPTENGTFAVSGRDLKSKIEWIYATDNSEYIIVNTENGIWIYDTDFNQLLSDFDYLNQSRRVLWVDIQ